MVIDSSALVAILLQEPEAPELGRSLEADPIHLMSSGNYLETALVIESRRGEPGARDLDRLMHALRAEIVSFTNEHAELARSAYRQFGKGKGRPGGLNFGDCMAYALAKSTGEPLLFKGNDFSQTDVARA